MYIFTAFTVSRSAHRLGMALWLALSPGRAVLCWGDNKHGQKYLSLSLFLSFPLSLSSGLFGAGWG